MDMQYNTLVSMLQAFVQSWGSDYKSDAVEPIIRHVAIPEVARAFSWRGTIKPYSLTLVVRTDTYATPYDFDKFYGRIKTKYGFLTEYVPEEFHARFPDRSGVKAQDLCAYCIEEYEGAKAQPTSAEKFSAVSSDASDTQTLLIRGEVGGYDDYEEITLNGLTAVQTTKSFTHMSYGSKSEITNGTITISGVTSAKVFCVIPPEHLTARYKRIVFNAEPQEALEVYGQYLMQTIYPKRSYDVMRIPGDLVFLCALSLLGWERRDPTGQLSIEKKYQDELKKAIYADRKSFSVDSKMELSNAIRKGYPDNYPLVDD